MSELKVKKGLVAQELRYCAEFLFSKDAWFHYLDVVGENIAPLHRGLQNAAKAAENFKKRALSWESVSQILKQHLVGGGHNDEDRLRPILVQCLRKAVEHRQADDNTVDEDPKKATLPVKVYLFWLYRMGSCMLKVNKFVLYRKAMHREVYDGIQKFFDDLTAHLERMPDSSELSWDDLQTDLVYRYAKPSESVELNLDLKNQHEVMVGLFGLTWLAAHYYLLYTYEEFMEARDQRLRQMMGVSRPGSNRDRRDRDQREDSTLDSRRSSSLLLTHSKQDLGTLASNVSLNEADIAGTPGTLELALFQESQQRESTEDGGTANQAESESAPSQHETQPALLEIDDDEASSKAEIVPVSDVIAPRLERTNSPQSSHSSLPALTLTTQRVAPRLKRTVSGDSESHASMPSLVYRNPQGRSSSASSSAQPKRADDPHAQNSWWDCCC